MKRLPPLSFSGMAVLGVMLIASTQPATAADAPAAPNKAAAPAAPAKAPAATPPKLSQQELNSELKTVDDYAAILQKAGFTVKKGKTSAGTAALSITWKNGTWAYYIDLTLNKIGNSQYLSLISPLANIPDMNKIPVVSVVRLLEVQDATQGWYFVLNSKSKRFYICRLVPAEKITAAVLLRELGVYESNVQQTERWWNPSAWTAKPAQPAANNQANNKTNPAPAKPAETPAKPQ